MRIGRLFIKLSWKTRWIEPRYGLDIYAYTCGAIIWCDGFKAEVIDVNWKKNKFKVRIIK